MNSQDNNFIISPKCGNSEEIEELEIDRKFASIKMSKKSKSLSGDDVEFEEFSKQNSQGRTSRNSLIAHKLALGSDQNNQIQEKKNSSHRIIKINPLTPRKKLDLKTVSGKGSTRNLESRQKELQLSSEAKRRRATETKKWSKKTSVLSYNMSSLLSSGINQSESGDKTQRNKSQEIEEVRLLKAQLKKNERRVQRIIQGK